MIFFYSTNTDLIRHTAIFIVFIVTKYIVFAK